jgi:hypothetical protein
MKRNLSITSGGWKGGAFQTWDKERRERILGFLGFDKEGAPAKQLGVSKIYRRERKKNLRKRK